MNELTKTEVVVAWICRIVAAVILLQTLFFKFSAKDLAIWILDYKSCSEQGFVCDR